MTTQYRNRTKEQIPKFFADNEDRNWMEWAKCKHIDAETADELFFSENKSDPYGAQREAYCGFCPVRDECFRYGQEFAPLDGAWGGVSEHRRRLIRRYQHTNPTIEQVRAEL